VTRLASLAAREPSGLFGITVPHEFQSALILEVQDGEAGEQRRGRFVVLHGLGACPPGTGFPHLELRLRPAAYSQRLLGTPTGWRATPQNVLDA
jgi:hypothetical protein